MFSKPKPYQEPQRVSATPEERARRLAMIQSLQPRPRPTVVYQLSPEQLLEQKRRQEQDLMNMRLTVRKNTPVPPIVMEKVVGPFLGPKRVPRTGEGVQSPWLKHLKDYQTKHGCSYKEAMKGASKTYR
jgi:hypothetical protein